MILSILNPKGGSGKTTLSANLARALRNRGRSVLLVDTDPQGSARDWHAADPDNPVELIAARREVTDGSPGAAFVITRRIEGTRLGNDVREALADYPLPTFDAAIAQRQAYPRTAATGRTVYDDDGDPKARAELAAVTDELLAAINGDAR